MAILSPLGAFCRPRVAFTLWSKIEKNTITGPLARPFARSLAPITCLLAQDCLLCSRPPLRSHVCLLPHSAHSLARGLMNDWMVILFVFFSIFDHSTLGPLDGYFGPWEGNLGLADAHLGLSKPTLGHWIAP